MQNIRSSTGLEVVQGGRERGKTEGSLVFFPDHGSFLLHDRFPVFPRARQLPAHVPTGPLINKESINGGLHGIPKKSEPTSLGRTPGIGGRDRVVGGGGLRLDLRRVFVEWKFLTCTRDRRSVSAEKPRRILLFSPPFVSEFDCWLVDQLDPSDNKDTDLGRCLIAARRT